MDKPIRYSMHAIQRRIERDVSENLVEQTVRIPDYTKTSFEGRKVYIEKETHISVITIY
ncbi:MAG: hypothetical protein QMD85_01920 [Candidatus Aenigmarchaeota archaeon]|nr:hypothetical protein [Candidatus Aenigmarchaeota archaeon]MDI6722307.1 hypothetical protein [Candidatus Aenigmarchaeota archaeon]